jgi:hypothetical protein
MATARLEGLGQRKNSNDIGNRELSNKCQTYCLPSMICLIILNVDLKSYKNIGESDSQV